MPYAALRSNLGKENAFHNAGGLIEQFQYANGIGARVMPLLSDSNAIGSGHLGYVGRVQKFFNFTQEDVFQAIQ